MEIANYIQLQDEITVIYRSLTMTGFTGRVIAIGVGIPGTREFVIVPTGNTLLHDGAIGVREESAVFSVRRGDAWVTVPSLLSPAEAESKSLRNSINEKKRIAKKAPLFADQIDVQLRPATEWIENARLSGEETLRREHDAALRATALRSQVQRSVTAEEYTQLVDRRERFPNSATYGIYFWNKQIEHIGTTGKPDISDPIPPSVAAKLALPWLKCDSHLSWTTAPGGAQQVRVLFIGSTEILVRLIGEPLRDYNPRLIPERNVWLTPDSLLPANPAHAASPC